MAIIRGVTPASVNPSKTEKALCASAAGALAKFPTGSRDVAVIAALFYCC
jgi:hypothetical protein